MLLKVAKIGDLTSNGNNIVKLQSNQETALGMASGSLTYYIAIKADTLKVAVDEEVELDISGDFTVTERAFTDENGDLPKDSDGKEISDADGNPLMLKWLKVA